MWIQETVQYQGGSGWRPCAVFYLAYLHMCVYTWHIQNILPKTIKYPDFFKVKKIFCLRRLSLELNIVYIFKKGTHNNGLKYTWHVVITTFSCTIIYRNILWKKNKIFMSQHIYFLSFSHVKYRLVYSFYIIQFRTISLECMVSFRLETLDMVTYLQQSDQAWHSARLFLVILLFNLNTYGEDIILNVHI